MKRALISVYDKSGIIDFAEGLVGQGWELISTGGTKKLLEEEGLKVLAVEEITNFPEILDGRVKTLNPHIHGGILSDRNKPDHMATLEEFSIQPIDMVINNLYPFEETVKNQASSKEDIVENIDIGGPSMIRAGAKNYKDVIIVTDPQDYASILQDLEAGSLDLEKRQALAAKAFRLTAFYDAMIAQYFTKEDYPELLTMPYRFSEKLRYGENPHQEAAYYTSPLEEDVHLKQVHGKQISFNNYNDMKAVIDLVLEFSEPVCVAAKHANPCGVALGKDAAQAYQRAYECDTQSIYGGIIGFNREVDLAAAEKLSKIFLEIIIAPSFTEEAFDLLTKKKNIRLIESDNIQSFAGKKTTFKDTTGGLLLQDRDNLLYSEEGIQLVTDRKPSDEELEELDFAWKVVKHCDSNAMVLAKDKKTIGLGHGEVRRVWAIEKAIERSEFSVEGAVVASDGFFFDDTIETLHQHGIRAIIQPGGSIQDEKVIEAANKYNISVLFTGMRHFRH